MKIFSLLLLLGLLETPSRAAPADWELAGVPSDNKLTATAPGVLEDFKAEPIQLRGVRGRSLNFQFVVQAGAHRIDKLEIKTSGLATIGADFIPAQNLKIYRENYVFIAHPSGNAVLKPKWWPDALIPLDLADQSVEAGKSAVFWATLKIPEEAVPGDYYGEIDFLADGAPRRLALPLTILQTAVSPIHFRATVAVYYDVLRDWYKKNGNVFTDEEWAAQKKRYYEFLLDFHLNAYDLPVSWDSPETEKYLNDPRVLSVRVPPLTSPDFPIALEKLKTTGTLSKAFYYWIDEPQTPEAFVAVRAAAQKLRPLGIKQLVTAHPNAALKNAVDIWCPNLGDFFGIGHLDIQALERERRAGRETWLYTMVEPKYPAPTWLVDDESASILAYSRIWQAGGFSGFVYSMAHGWGPKPLENIASFDGTNGDGTLVYPSELVGGSGPMPSIRLMVLREAIERSGDWRNGGGQWLHAEPATELRPATGKTVLDSGREKSTDYPLTTVSWSRQSGFLTVNFEASLPAPKEYAAVELAPRDGLEKWRFVLTAKGKKVVERHTRDGAFLLPDFQFEAATRSVTSTSNRKYFLKIPLRQIPWAKEGVRFEALRSTQMAPEGAHFIQRLTDKGADPFTWPLLAVDKAVPK